MLHKKNGPCTTCKKCHFYVKKLTFFKLDKLHSCKNTSAFFQKYIFM